jgi:hypothetical protein
VEWLFEFLRDAGGWGLLSMTAAIVSALIGVWNYNHNSPLSGFVWLCLTVPLFWAGAYVAWHKKRKELATAMSLPAKNVSLS